LHAQKTAPAGHQHAISFAEHAGLVRGEIDGAIRDDNIGPSIFNRHSRHIGDLKNDVRKTIGLRERKTGAA